MFYAQECPIPIALITLATITICGNVDETAALKAYNSIYLEVIMRYRDYIEEKEGLYLADLPRLVTPGDEAVVLLANDIKSRFPAYNYSSNFTEAANLSYEYVRGKIIPVSIPVQFWLRPAQTLKYGAGDVFDRAVLFCSTLIALGGISSRVVVVIKGNERHFIVYSEFGDRIIAFDIEAGALAYGSLEAMLKSMRLEDDEDSAAYEFNDKMYRDLD